ncbi:hypothetical protein ACUY20_05905 [Corynebacterium segmentosum]
MAYRIDPYIVQTHKAPVHVELAGALSTGMIVTDLCVPADDSGHTHVATHLDHAGFWRSITDV